MRGGIWIQSQGGKILAFVDIVEFVVYGERKNIKKCNCGKQNLGLRSVSNRRKNFRSLERNTRKYH